MDEAYASVALGVCVGLGVVLFLSNDQKPKRKSTEPIPPKSSSTTPNSPTTKSSVGYEEIDNISMGKDVKKTLQTKPHLQKFFGVHVEPPTEEAGTTEEDDGSDWDMLSLAVKFLSSVGLCTVLCVALNISSNGEFGRFILGMFPVEMEALKLTSILQKFKLH